MLLELNAIFCARHLKTGRPTRHPRAKRPAVDARTLFARANRFFPRTYCPACIRENHNLWKESVRPQDNVLVAGPVDGFDQFSCSKFHFPGKKPSTVGNDSSNGRDSQSGMQGRKQSDQVTIGDDCPSELGQRMTDPSTQGGRAFLSDKSSIWKC
jgi:hypothetical protein